MAYAGGYGGGYADLVEAPTPVRPVGSGGKPATWRWPDLQPWQPPAPPAPPPPQPPVRVRVVVHVCITTTARVTRLDTWVTIPGLRFGGRARLVGPPIVLQLHQLDKRSRDAQELSEIAMALSAWQRR